MPLASPRQSPMNPAPGAIAFRAADRARRAIDRAMAVDPAVLSRVFTQFDAGRIAAEAELLDRDEARRNGPLAGLTVSIKDLFDEAGVITTAGSAILSGAPAAARDAEAVRRLRAAGALACGRTTMSEFAYSGVGLNPHFGNPGNALDPTRIPGGSSSGGALSVALGIAEAALGSDTGGSVRIPAALNGLCGFKPTQGSVPLDGAFPLSGSYDSVGPLARTVAACAAVYAVLSASRPQAADALPPKPRIGIVGGVLTEGLDAAVAGDYAVALDTLSAAGWELAEAELPFLDGYGNVNRILVAGEAHAVHRERLDALETVGDPRVLKRIRAAEGFGETDTAAARARRAAAIAAFAAVSGFDAFVAPTLPTVAPGIAEVEADFDRLNALMLRNPSAVNFLDGCAATVPMHRMRPLATGLMIFAPGGCDWRVLALAQQAESLLS